MDIAGAQPSNILEQVATIYRDPPEPVNQSVTANINANTPVTNSQVAPVIPVANQTPVALFRMPVAPSITPVDTVLEVPPCVPHKKVENRGGSPNEKLDSGYKVQELEYLVTSHELQVYSH